jgi:hypothetical protein
LSKKYFWIDYFVLKFKSPKNNFDLNKFGVASIKILLLEGRDIIRLFSECSIIYSYFMIFFRIQLSLVNHVKTLKHEKICKVQTSDQYSTKNDKIFGIFFAQNKKVYCWAWKVFFNTSSHWTLVSKKLNFFLAQLKWKWRSC